MLSHGRVKSNRVKDGMGKSADLNDEAENPTRR